jgi:hypothetical protein
MPTLKEKKKFMIQLTTCTIVAASVLSMYLIIFIYIIIPEQTKYTNYFICSIGLC